MRRIRALIGVTGCALATMSACGLEDKGALDPGGAAAGGIGGSGVGGTSVGGGSCFPNSKVCKDPATGQSICFDSNTPETGCAVSTACDPCSTPHATAKCSEANDCAIDACEEGFKDCNGTVDDGCESNSASDPKNCGDCLVDCTVGAPNQICLDGSCQINNCNPATLLDCNQDPADGCEVDSASDPNNCLFCGNVCALANADAACQAQQCVIATCHGGWKDCDGSPANGCETHIDADPGNCGDCGVTCPNVNGAPECTGGSCKILCQADFADCDPSQPGCESSTKTVDHCGGCSPCTPQNVGTAKCGNGSCSYDACLAGFGDCDAKKSNGCEVNLTNSNANCGTCGKVCTQGRACQASKCVCTSGLDCGAAGCQTCCGNPDCPNAGEKCCSGKCQQGSC